MVRLPCQWEDCRVPRVVPGNLSKDRASVLSVTTQPPPRQHLIQKAMMASQRPLRLFLPRTTSILLWSWYSRDGYSLMARSPGESSQASWTEMGLKTRKLSYHHQHPYPGPPGPGVLGWVGQGMGGAFIIIIDTPHSVGRKGATSTRLLLGASPKGVPVSPKFPSPGPFRDPQDER